MEIEHGRSLLGYQMVLGLVPHVFRPTANQALLIGLGGGHVARDARYEIKNLTSITFYGYQLRLNSLRLNRSLNGVEADNSLRLRSANGLFLCFITKLTVLTAKPFCLSRLKLVAQF